MLCGTIFNLLTILSLFVNKKRVNDPNHSIILLIEEEGNFYSTTSNIKGKSYLYFLDEHDIISYKQDKLS